MILLNGDKVKMVNPIEDFGYVGAVCEVIDILPSGIIIFEHHQFGTGLITWDEFEEYFEKTRWTEWYTLYSAYGDFECKTDEKKIIVKRNGVKACASCSPEDEFDLLKGLNLCLARLRVKELEVR